MKPPRASDAVAYDLAHRLLVQGTPNLEWFGSWNDWSVALLGCIIFDVFSGREAAGRRPGRKQPHNTTGMD